MDQPFIGQIQAFGFNFAPRGWDLCNGQLLAISQFQALFSLLGTTYGGDGRSSFGLPDLRGRAPIGFGAGPGLSDHLLGQKSGAETVTLNVTQLPSHNHTFTPTGGGGGSVMVSSKAGTSPTPSSSTSTLGALADANLGTANNAYNNETPDTPLNIGSGGSGGGTVGNTGNSLPISIMQPYLAINYSIAMQGIFPSRN